MTDKPFAEILEAVDRMAEVLVKFMGQVDYVKEVVMSLAQQVNTAVLDGQMAVKAEKDNLYALELEKRALLDRLEAEEADLRNKIQATEKEHARVRELYDVFRKEVGV